MQKQRSLVDLILGIATIALGAFVLLNSAFATAVSVWVIGWFALIGGAATAIAALLRLGDDRFWTSILSGVLMFVLGLMILRNTAIGAVSLTLMAGTVFLADGLSRIFLSAKLPGLRGWLLVASVISTILGLIVFFNLFAMSFTLLGVLLGVNLLVDGLALLMVGRPRRLANR